MAVSDFGRKVREGRDRLGLTQVQFAKKVGVASNTVSAWETGRFDPEKPENLEGLAALLETSVDALLGRQSVDPEAQQAYRLGLYHAAKELRELAARLESGGPDVNARQLVKAGEDAGEGVGVQGVQKGHKGADSGGKVRNRGQHDRLPKK